MSNSQTEWWAPVQNGEQPSDLFAGDAGARGGGGESRRARTTGRARAARARQRRRRRSILVLFMALVLVGGAGYVVIELMGGVTWFDRGGEAAAIEDFPGPGRPSARIVVKSGDTGAMIGQTLVDAGVVATVSAFSDAYQANPAASSIQPGTYDLLLEMKASDAVELLLTPSARASLDVTIPEGRTAAEIFVKVNEVTGIPIEELQAAAADPAAIGLPAEAGGNVEGWLFPFTYAVDPGTPAAAVLQQMIAKTVALLQEKGVPQDQWQTVLNKASLIEREGRRDEDRPKMAEVINNRIDRGIGLEIDAAVAYGAGKSGADLTTEDLDNADNPYNTYTHLGLPPSPIASPGEESIDAVLSPEVGNLLFWMTVNPETGETKFAETNAEHEEYRDEYRAWMAEHGQK